MNFFTFILIFFAVSTNASAIVLRSEQSLPLNIQSSMIVHHKYDIILNLKIKPLRVISFDALSDPIKFQLVCSETIVGNDEILFDDSMSGQTINFTITAFDIRSKCGTSSFQLKIMPNGVELDTDLSSAAYSLVDRGEDTDGFIQRMNKDEGLYASDMIYYHSQMAISISNRKSLHCLIKSYQSDDVLVDVVHDLKIQYKNFFSQEYVTGAIDCSQGISLATEISNCATTSHSQFCSNYRLYSESKSWFVENLALATQIYAQIPATLTDLRQQLKDVEDRMQGTLDKSLAQTAPKPSANP